MNHLNNFMQSKYTTVDSIMEYELWVCCMPTILSTYNSHRAVWDMDRPVVYIQQHSTFYFYNNVNDWFSKILKSWRKLFSQRHDNWMIIFAWDCWVFNLSNLPSQQNKT